MSVKAAKMKRDSKDYDSNTAAIEILNNEDHTLKKDQFNGTIDDYNSMFSGARKTTGKITDAESIELP